jgi:uncharacterized membrane protein
MNPPHSADPFRTFIDLIEFIGALIIVGHVIGAIVVLLRKPRGRQLLHARLLVAQGAITGMDFKLAASLLKTLQLHTWTQIGAFTLIFLLRTVLKRFFTWEKTNLAARNPATTTPT